MSIGFPNFVVKTRPLSCHSEPTRSLSSPCRCLCSIKAFTVDVGRGIVRREREVLGSSKCQPTPFFWLQTIAQRTVAVHLLRSMSDHFSARYSCGRMTVVRAKMNSADTLVLLTAPRNAQA